MSVMGVGLQREVIARKLEARGIPADTVDVSALIDETLHLPENVRSIEAQLGLTLGGEAETVRDVALLEAAFAARQAEADASGEWAKLAADPSGAPVAYAYAPPMGAALEVAASVGLPVVRFDRARRAVAFVAALRAIRAGETVAFHLTLQEAVGVPVEWNGARPVALDADALARVARIRAAIAAEEARGVAA